jgi:hypothetical protein
MEFGITKPMRFGDTRPMGCGDTRPALAGRADESIGKVASVPEVVITWVTEGGPHSDEDWSKRLSVRKLISKPFSPDIIVTAVKEILPPPVGKSGY